MHLPFLKECPKRKQRLEDALEKADEADLLRQLAIEKLNGHLRVGAPGEEAEEAKTDERPTTET